MTNIWNRQILFGVIAGIITLSLLGMNAALAIISGPSYLTVSSAGVGCCRGDKMILLDVTTGGDIPRQPTDFIKSHLVAGIVWTNSDYSKAFMAVIHPVLGRDSNQNPDSWHLHTATLSSGAGSADFCVVSIDSNPKAGIKIKGDTMNISAKQSDVPLTVGNLGLSDGFVIDPEPACSSGLGLSRIF